MTNGVAIKLRAVSRHNRSRLSVRCNPTHTNTTNPKQFKTIKGTEAHGWKKQAEEKCRKRCTHRLYILDNSLERLDFYVKRRRNWQENGAQLLLRQDISQTVFHVLPWIKRMFTSFFEVGQFLDKVRKKTKTKCYC